MRAGEDVTSGVAVTPGGPGVGVAGTVGSPDSGVVAGVERGGGLGSGLALGDALRGGLTRSSATVVRARSRLS